jgi:hypothetical protein
MAYLSETYTAADLPESAGYDILPAGWYTASISGAEVKSTKAGTGQYIAIKLTITGPNHQGRVVFGNLHIKNPNPKAEEIGRMELGNLKRAIGLAKVTDTDELIGGELAIKIIVKPAEGQYEESNEIKGYKSQSGSMPVTTAAKPAATAATSSAKAAPPWAKK